MMSPDVSGWIDALLVARSTRQPAPVDPLVATLTLAEAEQVQALHLERVLSQIGGRVTGFKLGACNQAALDTLGLAEPFHGPLLSARTYASGAVLARSDFLVCVIEAEIGVRFGRAIDSGEGPLSRDDLADAIDRVFPVIEVADARFENWSAGPAAAIVSDLGLSGALVVGGDCADWRSLDLASLPVALTRNGEPIREGSGAAVLGDPLDALRRAMTTMQRAGKSIPAGTLVSTGNCTAPFVTPIEGGRFVADFGPLGEVSVDLRAD